MARYTVQITFKVAGLRRPVEKVVHGLPGRRPSVRLYGSEGMLAATGAVHEDSPADAAMAVAREVGRQWSKADGPLQLVAWTAHRERALALLGRRERGVGGTSLIWDDGDDPGEEGGAGVREPRRPLPGPGSMSAALDLPTD